MLASAILIAYIYGVLSYEYFFDEAWRIDIIHANNSFERYLTNNAPIPPLWILLMKLTCKSCVNFKIVRLISAFYSALFHALFGTLVYIYFSANKLKRKLEISPSIFDGIHSIDFDRNIFILGVSSVFFISSISGNVGEIGVSGYVNDYLFQSMIVSLFIILWLLSDIYKLNIFYFNLIFLLIPLSSIAGLFLLPSAAVWLFLRSAAEQKSAFNRLIKSMPLPIIALVISLCITKFAYMPVIDGGLHSYWKSDFINLNDNQLKTVVKIIESIGSGVNVDIRWGTSHINNNSFIYGLLLFICFVSGIGGFYRLWKWLPIAIISSYFLIIIFSVFGLWPATMSRVNFPLLWIFYFFSFIGFFDLLIKVFPNWFKYSFVAAVIFVCSVFCLYFHLLIHLQTWLILQGVYMLI